MDIVFVKQLAIDTVIGVYEWEKTIQQRLFFDLELTTDIRAAASDDDLRLTLDYAVVCQRVTALVQAEPVEYCRNLLPARFWYKSINLVLCLQLRPLVSALSGAVSDGQNLHQCW